ncbi:hypothetical protein F4861DRAFT_265948 [Xylaria intraflava]|nr:hypothetical protein F4861DRAFT_265948 [Xylaria intraflava]
MMRKGRVLISFLAMSMLSYTRPHQKQRCPMRPGAEREMLAQLVLCTPTLFNLHPSFWLLALSHNLHRTAKVGHPRSACNVGAICVIDTPALPALQ